MPQHRMQSDPKIQQKGSKLNNLTDKQFYYVYFDKLWTLSEVRSR